MRVAPITWELLPTCPAHKPGESCASMCHRSVSSHRMLREESCDGMHSCYAEHRCCLGTRKLRCCFGAAPVTWKRLPTCPAHKTGESCGSMCHGSVSSLCMLREESCDGMRPYCAELRCSSRLESCTVLWCCTRHLEASSNLSWS